MSQKSAKRLRRVAKRVAMVEMEKWFDEVVPAMSFRERLKIAWLILFGRPSDE